VSAASLASRTLEIDPNRPLDALVEAKRLLQSGTRFVAKLEPIRARSPFAVATGGKLLEQFNDIDERVGALDALAREELVIDGKSQRDLSKVDPRLIQTTREILALSDGVVVRSWIEHYRLEQALSVTVEPFFVEPSTDCPIPSFTRAERPDAVVVWAPLAPARELALIAFALEELHLAVYVVCSGGDAPAMRAGFVPYERAEAVLPLARVIVDASRSQPGNALEFARRGFPLAVSWSTGAFELLDGVSSFIPWDRADILRAVQRALGSHSPSFRPDRAVSTRRVLTATPENIFEMFAQAVRLREEGIEFDLALRFPERRTGVAIAVAGEVCVEVRDRSRRRNALDAIGRNDYTIRGEKIETLLAVGLPVLQAMRDLMGLADRLIVRSWTEWERITYQFATLPQRVEVVPSYDDTVPAIERKDPNGSVVVWAPRTPLVKLAIVTEALDELGREAVIVCHGSPLSPTEVREALSRASVVVDADNDDPGPARALASLGIPLCVTTTSGAREYVTGVHPYRPWHRRSMIDAVRASIESAPPRHR